MGINTDYDQFERERAAIGVDDSVVMTTAQLDRPHAAIGLSASVTMAPTQLDRIESLLVYIAEALTDDGDPDDVDDDQPASTLDDAGGGTVHTDDEL